MARFHIFNRTCHDNLLSIYNTTWIYVYFDKLIRHEARKDRWSMNLDRHNFSTT